MAYDHRIKSNGQPICYTCENKRFVTNINKGFSHNPFNQVMGSVLNGPLVNHGYTLWLEHVIDKQNNNEVYWLMWYDNNGIPTIPMSGILDKQELSNMLAQLANFIP